MQKEALTCLINIPRNHPEGENEDGLPTLVQYMTFVKPSLNARPLMVSSDPTQSNWLQCHRGQGSAGQCSRTAFVAEHRPKPCISYE